MKKLFVVFSLVCWPISAAQELGFYESESSGQWIIDLINDAGTAENDCSDEQLATIKRAKADDYYCLVDLGYPGRPFDQDVSTHTMIDLQNLPGQYASGGAYSPTPDFSGFENTVDGHKATLTFEDGYVATIAISPYGSVAIFGRYRR